MVAPAPANLVVRSFVPRGLFGDEVERRALYSADERYRYALLVQWNESLIPMAVIGLNPSTATERQDDPTIRRCIGFSKRFGYGGLLMLNLAGFRATDPRWMFRQADPIGPGNVPEQLSKTLFNLGWSTLTRGGNRRVHVALAAWGVHGDNWQLRHQAMAFYRHCHLNTIEVQCLGGLTSNGQPRHPLYLRKDAPVENWHPPAHWNFQAITGMGL